MKYAYAAIVAAGLALALPPVANAAPSTGVLQQLDATTGAYCRTAKWWQCRRYIRSGVVRCGWWYRSFPCR